MSAYGEFLTLCAELHIFLEVIGPHNFVSYSVLASSLKRVPGNSSVNLEDESSYAHSTCFGTSAPKIRRSTE